MTSKAMKILSAVWFLYGIDLFINNNPAGFSNAWAASYFLYCLDLAYSEIINPEV